MKVLGKRANMCLFVYPLLFIVCVVIAWYFGDMLVDYWTALANDDMEEVERLGEIIDSYTVRRSVRRIGFMINPLGYVIYALLGEVYCIYAFNRRITQPRDLIECDDKNSSIISITSSDIYKLKKELKDTFLDSIESIFIKYTNFNE